MHSHMRIGAISAEAGIQGSTESGHAEVPASTPASEEIENGGPSSSSARPDSGVPRAEGSSGGSSKHAIEHDDVGERQTFAFLWI